MKINCQLITDELINQVTKKYKRIYKPGYPLKTVVFTVSTDKLTKIFVRNKKALAKQVGFELEVVNFKKPPLFQDFATKLRTKAHSRKFHAVIIQRPLSAELASPTLENFIPIKKEVEGHKHKSPYSSPAGMATLSILKFVYTEGNTWKIRPEDTEFFKRNFKKKFIVMAGRGATTGQPIATTLVRYKMALVITHSQTPNPDMFYKQADVLITATGQPIINYHNIKSNSILINFGYRLEKRKTLGDYNEEDIKDKAAYYTPILKGTGPLMLAYLMKNIVEAYERQIK